MYSLIDKISDLLNTVISDISTKISDISTKINTLNTTVTNGFNKSNIKSIQKGTYSPTSYSGEATINISSINPNKSIVILNGSAKSNSNVSGGDLTYQIILSSLTSTNFTVNSASSNIYLSKFSWQVIEFY